MRPSRPPSRIELRKRVRALPGRSGVHVERAPTDSRWRFVGNLHSHGLRSACTVGPEGTGTRRVRRRRYEVMAWLGTQVRDRSPATALPGEGERSAFAGLRVTVDS